LGGYESKRCVCVQDKRNMVLKVTFAGEMPKRGYKSFHWDWTRQMI